jgi:endonuclease/exonuclease/phosphatase family metal-dependent hydrolase
LYSSSISAKLSAQTMSSLPFAIPDPALEFGDNNTQKSTSDQNKLVIASYNIRYARGPFLISGGILRKIGLLPSRRRPQTVSRNIRKASAAFTSGQVMPAIDVLALQEADKQTVRSGGVHVARELAAELGMTWVHAPAGIPRGIKPVQREWWLDFEEPIQLHDSGDTGIALISRHSLSDVVRIDLPWHKCPWRPRLAMAATISFGKKSLRLFNVHVDPHAASGGQLEQLEAIAEQAEAWGGPTVIVGDFNTLSKQKCTDTRSFLEARSYTTPFQTGTATWRGSGLRLHADWIFTKDVSVTKSGVGRPLNSSDHWPVWVEIEM